MQECSRDRRYRNFTLKCRNILAKQKQMHTNMYFKTSPITEYGKISSHPYQYLPLLPISLGEERERSNSLLCRVDQLVAEVPQRFCQCLIPCQFDRCKFVAIEEVFSGHTLQTWMQSDVASCCRSL